ncbi:hypothetical protein HPB50_003720 [Hyalomma asiaticum]|uniref:Uncharacterized protein n=1 Tax=Hyalomma asiaticum TaxID=266040 RepID=A0ACB7SHS3_HYAAI|nr:hypothetical protein HPB50_003720 [Hyalomma asiaticum]
MDKAAERPVRRAAAARARRSDPAVRAREAEASRDSARRRRKDPAVRALTLLTSFIEMAFLPDFMKTTSSDQTVLSELAGMSLDRAGFGLCSASNQARQIHADASILNRRRLLLTPVCFRNLRVL